MLGNVKAGAHDENQGKNIAPDFEIHPLLGGVVTCHIGVECGHEETVQNPGNAQSVPSVIGQFNLRAQHAFEKVFLQDELRHHQTKGHAAVQQGGFELDETVVVEKQGQAAEHDDQRKTGPLQRSQFAF